MTCKNRNPIKTIKTTATSPIIEAVLYSEDEFLEIPDGAVCSFLVYATIVGVRTEIIRGVCTITDALNGEVEYKLTAANLSAIPGPGEYSAYFELDYGSDPVYYPTPGHIRFIVERL